MSLDVDGDGRTELALGSNLAGADYEGIVAVWAAPLSGSRVLADALGSYVGVAGLDRVGNDLANAGDVEGDGREDLLVGADGDSSAAASAGAVYLLPGSAF